MQLRPSDDEMYKSLYRDRFNEVPLPETYIPFENVTTPRVPREVYNGIYLPSYDYVRDPRFLRERRIREYQTITGVDRVLGQLRTTLDRLGESDNTIIVFSTDHGIHHGEHGLGGKCFLYEEDLRIPMIVFDPRLPDAARGQVREEMVAVPDLAPTMLELADEAIPDTMQGTSMVPLLNGGMPEWRDALFTEQLMDIQNYPRSESIRSSEWKYIRYFARTEDPAQEGLPFRGTLDNYQECLTSTLDGREEPIYEELYHLAEDPSETTNEAANPAHAGVLEEFRRRLLQEARALV
jgi:arylsulfatase A-like enzyme